MLGAISTGFMVLNQYLTEEKRLSAEAVVNLLATVVRRTFEIQAPSGGEQRKNRHLFHELFDQARELSRKKVE